MLDTVVAVVASIKQRAGGINQVKYCIRVFLLTSRKNHNLELFTDLEQALMQAGPDVDARLDRVRFLLELDINQYFSPFNLHIFHTVNQRLIQIEHHSFLMP